MIARLLAAAAKDALFAAGVAVGYVLASLPGAEALCDRIVEVGDVRHLAA